MSRLDRFYAPPEIGAPGRRRGRTMRRDLWMSGLFVLGMAALALILLSVILPGFGQRTYWLQADFLDAKGLEAGARVIQHGYVIGLVERVEPVFGTEGSQGSETDRLETCQPLADITRHRPVFRARLRLFGDWPIPADSQAQVGSTGALQGDAVKIRPGTSPTRLASGDCILTLSREADVADHVVALADTLTRLSTQVMQLVDETLTPALQRIARQIENLETLLGTGTDPSAAASGQAVTFKSLRDYLNELETALDPEDIRRILDDVGTGSSNLADFSAALNRRAVVIEQTLLRISVITERLEQAIREDHPPLQQAIADSQYLLQELAASVTPILTNIEETTRNLSDLSRELRHNPRSLFKSHGSEPHPTWFHSD